MFPFIQNAGNSKLRITSFGFGRNMNEWKDECLRSSKAELIPILFSATKRDYRVFNRAFFFNFFFKKKHISTAENWGWMYCQSILNVSLKNFGGLLSLRALGLSIHL